ncbi:MAG TPA: HEAT repeat domain-containing protein, partial [Candidatus Norongarragalinales archaeon]|nr:HEAT repeat domain-containing protein [Candidatus Norongarragalinales archaeon]
VKNTGMWVLKHFRKLPQGIVQTIAEQLNHRDEKVRREAAIALWDMKAREQLPALEKAIKREQSSSLTQSTIANAIIHIENSARTHAFLKANGINPERFKGTGPLPLPRFVKK